MLKIYNFYQSVFPEQTFSKIFEKMASLGNYPLIFTLSGQSDAFKNYFCKSKLRMPQICGVTKKEICKNILNFGNFLLLT